MKRTIILSLAVFGLFFSSLTASRFYNNNIEVEYFYSALDSYGEWVEVGYDDYVWRPYKSDHNWRPYSEGRWEWTKHGWYWVSYEPFGWATFHYGRWYHDDYYGWVWMPDNVWAPAWVEWRYNDFHIGWAPLPPYAKFNHGHGIHFSISWHSGHHYWSFVKYNHFASHNIHNHFVDRHYVKNVYRKTKYRTNYFANNNRIVNGGVSRKFVERKIGKKFNTRKITRTSNYNEYKKRGNKSRNNIVDFRPTERSVKSSKFDRKSVIKGKSLKSFRKDKVAINKRTANRKDISKKSIKTDRKVQKQNRSKIDSKRMAKREAKITNRKDIDKKKIEKKTKSTRISKKADKNKSVKKKSITKNNERKKIAKNGYSEKSNKRFAKNNRGRAEGRKKSRK